MIYLGIGVQDPAPVYTEAAEATGTAAAHVLTTAVEVTRQSQHLSAEIARYLTTVRAA